MTEITKFNESLGIQLTNESNYYIPDIVSSYSLKKKIVNKKWKTKKYVEEVNLIEYWEINKINFLTNLINSIKSLFRNKFYDEKLDHLRIAIEKIDKLISHIQSLTKYDLHDFILDVSRSVLVKKFSVSPPLPNINLIFIQYFSHYRFR